MAARIMRPAHHRLEESAKGAAKTPVEVLPIVGERRQLQNRLSWAVQKKVFSGTPTEYQRTLADSTSRSPAPTPIHSFAPAWIKTKTASAFHDPAESSVPLPPVNLHCPGTYNRDASPISNRH